MKNDQESKEYRKLGLTLFTVLAAAILFYFAMLRLDSIGGVIGGIVSALKPLMGGIAMAYILRPVAMRLEGLMTGGKKCRLPQKLARILSVIITVLAALALVTVFIIVVLPSLIETLRSLITTLPGQISQLIRAVDEYLEGNTEIQLRVNDMVRNVEVLFTNWISKDLLGSAMAVISNVISVLYGFVSAFIAIVVAVYLLLGWEKYIGKCKKLFVALCRNTSFSKATLDTMAEANRIFSGFITGKLIDSLIVWALCFICMTLFRMPYPMLISFIIGVTNIIPVFGPFIGAVPSAFLILLVSPVQCLWFIVFILVLQQIDGNIIGPRILGDSIGLSALYITIAMLVFSKLFGVLGMILGVPLFGILYYLVKRFAEAELKRRGLST